MSDRLALDDRAGAAETGETWGSTTSEPLSGGCHAGADEMRKAAESAGKSEMLERYAADYPKGPHDQPQSMCPAFGSLRVGLRMRRTATVLSGSACCVYGLTFTSHFYGARRTVGYVPFNSETLVTGKLFEDIREAVFQLADPELYDTVVVTNLCVPTASGVPLQLLPKEINGVRIIGIDVPGFGVPTHAEAKDVLAGAMLKYARGEAEQGPVAAPREQSDKPTITLLGEMFPVDPVGIGMMLEPLGLAAGPVVPTREWRELYAALDCAAVAAIHPFYTASVREFVAAGRQVVGSAPVGHDGTAAWLDAIGKVCGIAQSQVDASKNRFLPAIRGALSRHPDQGPDHPQRLRGLGASGRAPADRERRGCALRRHGLSAHPMVRSGSRVAGEPTACGCSSAPRWNRIIAAFEEFGPDLAIGTTPVVQHAKQRRVPALYFTNLISARPLMGPAGAGSLAQVVNGAIANKERFDKMSAFFEGVGTGHAAGVWETTPVDRPEFKAKHAKARAALRAQEEAVGT